MSQRAITVASQWGRDKQHTEKEKERERMKMKERERERERDWQRERERARLCTVCRMRADTHGDQKRGGKHIAAYYHRGITAVTQHATERATDTERETREMQEGEMQERERKRERAREKERGGCWFVGQGC